MAKAEWGLKRVCPQCATRYYDMKKNPPVCPNCGTVYDPESTTRSRRGRAAPKAAAAAPVEVATDDVELPVADGEESDDALIEDAEELGEDDAVEEVVEVEEDN